MTDDRTIPAVTPRSDHVARLGIGLYKCGIIAAFCLLSSVLCPLATADGIYVSKMEVRLGKEGYRISASYDVNLNFAVQQALSRGIPLYFVSEFSLTRTRWDWLDAAQQALLRAVPRYFFGETPPPRWSWLDEEVFTGEQTVKLSYNVLTRRYRISRGTLLQNFASFEDALNMLSRQSFTTIPAELMSDEGNYMAATRLRLDIAQLPRLLQVNALTSKDWTLDSGWYQWMINPAEMTVGGEGGAE